MAYLDAIRQFFSTRKQKNRQKSSAFLRLINSPQTQIPADMLFGEELFFWHDICLFIRYSQIKNKEMCE